MKRNFILLLNVATLLVSCMKSKETPQDSSTTPDIFVNQAFDSLIWQLYDVPDDSSSLLFNWNWAYAARKALGIENLDSLARLSQQRNDMYVWYAENGFTEEAIIISQFDANVAMFNMLNAYQDLSQKTNECFSDSAYYYDYVLWDKVFSQFEANYVDAGNFRGVELNGFYEKVAQLRTEALYRELALFADDASVETDIPDSLFLQQSSSSYPAVGEWLEHRLGMAAILQEKRPALAEAFRNLSCKLAAQYAQFVIENDNHELMDD